jgi:hypothetical protein
VGRCQAARVVSYEAMERCRGAGRLAEAPADELARELHHGATALRIMQARQEELEREAEARLRSGEWVPQYYLDDVPGKRELAVTPDIAEMLTGVRATKTVRRSPADMERDGADPAVMRTISRASRGRQRLARFTKKDADRIFGR